MDYDLISAIVTTAMIVFVIAGLTAAHYEKGLLAAVFLVPVGLLLATIMIGSFVYMWIDAIR
jgi:ABC-type multidrug transport system permease subunit